MRVEDKELPVVLQAYETTDRDEKFIAEQVVHTQVEADGFTSRFSGLLIKARPLNQTEVETVEPGTRKRRTSSAAIWIFVVVFILMLALIGYYTGWIQRTFNWNPNF